MFSSRKKLKGSVLGFSLIMLSLFLFSGITLVSVSILERKTSFSNQKSLIAFQGAESGVERILKMIYGPDIDDPNDGNSPPLAVVLLGETMPAHEMLDDIVTDIDSVTGASCAGGIITATNTPSTSPDYVFSVSFLNQNGTTIACDDIGWRDKLVRIRSEGVYQRTSRVVEVGIRPRE